MAKAEITPGVIGPSKKSLDKYLIMWYKRFDRADADPV